MMEDRFDIWLPDASKPDGYRRVYIGVYRTAGGYDWRDCYGFVSDDQIRSGGWKVVPAAIAKATGEDDSTSTPPAKNAHTPGPWWVDETVLWRIRCNPTPQVDTGTTVCEMCSDRTIAETAANARLIAAAPELLAALEAIVSRFDDHGLGRDFTGEYVSAARAAIAKATGEVGR